MSLDNRVSEKEKIQLLIPVEQPSEFICISCLYPFWVFPRPAHSGVEVNQTLYCQECLTHLRNCITREKNNDYGW